MYNSLLGGSIEVITGPMFAGKTEELIRRIQRYEYAKIKYLVFKPAIDNRYTTKEIVSHNNNRKNTVAVSLSTDILKHIDDDIKVVFIDEAQFFDDKIIQVAEALADNDIKVIVAGLDRDFRGEPFGPMPKLLAIAEKVIKLTAICMKSGLEASRTQRIINGSPANYNDPIILIGATESYEARARKYHEVPGKPNVG